MALGRLPTRARCGGAGGRATSLLSRVRPSAQSRRAQDPRRRALQQGLTAAPPRVLDPCACVGLAVCGGWRPLAGVVQCVWIAARRAVIL